MRIECQEERQSHEKEINKCCYKSIEGYSICENPECEMMIGWIDRTNLVDANIFFA